jgi:hypothetical protein
MVLSPKYESCYGRIIWQAAVNSSCSAGGIAGPNWRCPLGHPARTAVEGLHLGVKSLGQPDRNKRAQKIAPVVAAASGLAICLIGYQYIASAGQFATTADPHSRVVAPTEFSSYALRSCVFLNWQLEPHRGTVAAQLPHRSQLAAGQDNPEAGASCLLYRASAPCGQCRFPARVDEGWEVEWLAATALRDCGPDDLMGPAASSRLRIPLAWGKHLKPATGRKTA